jgi:hypothetical protein
MSVLENVMTAAIFGNKSGAIKDPAAHSRKMLSLVKSSIPKIGRKPRWLFQNNGLPVTGVSSRGSGGPFPTPFNQVKNQ